MADKMGGAAFPRLLELKKYRTDCDEGYEIDSAKGMTLWDWYAGHALGGLGSIDDLCLSDTTRIAAELADAMLIEREKRKP